MKLTPLVVAVIAASLLAPSTDARARVLQSAAQNPAEQKLEFTAADLANELNTAGTVRVRGIVFDTGKATIRPESFTVLAQVGEVLKSTKGLRLEIQGHTADEGTPAANLTLSEQRAAAVKTYLVQKFGIDGQRLTTKGFGDTKPIGDNATPDGRAQNRRVELVKR